MDPLVTRIKTEFGNYSAATLPDILALYSKDIFFQDPFTQLSGIDAVSTYFGKLADKVSSCKFEFTDQFLAEGEAALFWTMRYSLLSSPQTLRVLTGCSHLKFNDKIFYHRDYFDAGQLLYEQLPLLGAVIRWIKRKI